MPEDQIVSISNEPASSPTTGTEIGNAVDIKQESTPAQKSVRTESVSDKIKRQADSNKVTGEKTTQSEAPAVEAPTYTPNYKFKVHDEEKEFDEFLRGSIKDSDTEKKARELYEKAYGLDVIKPKHEELKKRLPEVEQKYSQLNETINEVLDLSEKDLGLFFERIKIPEERVAQWMLERIKKMELPPEQRMMYDQFEQTKRQNFLLQKQLETGNSQSQAQQAHARAVELDAGLQRPDVTQFVQTFDAARKSPGAFRQEVQECGQYEWLTNRVDISAAEAIRRVMSRYSGFMNQSAAANESVITTQQDPKALPVIPKVQGKAVSATSKQVKSIDDLKKRYREISNG